VGIRDKKEVVGIGKNMVKKGRWMIDGSNYLRNELTINAEV
jgi:hypothetical protein